MLAAALLLVAGVAVHPAAAEREQASERYRDCLRLAEQDARKAVGRARTWKAQGGGDPARHCLAVALLNDGRPAKAADKLMALARTLEPDSGPVLRAETLAQAGQAYLLADKLKKAETAHSKALKLDRDNPKLWLDRAMVRFQRGDYTGAVQDLNRAQSHAPKNPKIYVYRASALRHMDQLKAAMQDARTAVELAPRNPEALLEKGNLHKLRGEPEKARKAWSRILAVAPTSRAAEAARTNLTSGSEG